MQLSTIHWPATLAGLIRDGYLPIAPSRDAAEHDAETVALDRCPQCAGRLSYRPFTCKRPADHAATSYRAFAVCLSCGTATEF